jgi:carbamoyl-phosphate synthase large subunit
MRETAQATVLISSAGRRAQLVSCVRDAGQRLGITTRVVASDAKPELSAAAQLANRAVKVPRCTDPEFIPELLTLCKDERVRLLIPTIDTELPILSAHQAEFAKLGVKVAISSPAVVALARDKEKTAVTLQAAGVATPKTMSAVRYAEQPTALKWPVILKPRGGSSSVGILCPPTFEDAVAAARDEHELIAQELWRGREYTVNMFFDQTGAMRCAIPHWRIETRGGEVSKGRTEDVQVLRTAATKIAGCLVGARAVLCFQAIVDDRNEAAVFEINARFGGGYPLAHQAGARFTQWLLEESLGLPSTANDQWARGLTMLRYDSAVFIDG